MQSLQKWILDFEGFQINGNFYPLELCLLSFQRPTDDLHIWHIGYTDSLAIPFNESTNKTIRWQSNKHGMGWKHGNMNPVDVFADMRDLFTTRFQHEIHVKGLEKAKWIEEWFNRNANVKVIEITCAPSYRDMNMYYGAMFGHPCSFHRDAPHLRCACRKANYLRDYIV